MNVRIPAMAIAAAVALGTSLSAQNVTLTIPAQFVVSGKAAEQIQDFSTINLATAERIAETCEKLAAAENVAISIYVLDNDGNHVYMDRMDGQGYLNIITAEMKARTALAQRAPSKVVMNQVRRDPNSEMQRVQLGLFANSGGLPIVINHQMIGVIGVGGSAPRVPVWSDEICGHKAMEQVLGANNVAPLVEDVANPPATPPANPAPVPRFTTATTPKTSVSNPAWVVSGKGASTVFDGNQISLAAAKQIAKVCRDFAAGKGGSMSLYVLDNFGEFVHMERMDGQVFNNTGGLPIVVDGQMIGSVGVGGGAGGGGDENCAIEGLKATFGDHVTLPAYPAAAPRTAAR